MFSCISFAETALAAVVLPSTYRYGPGAIEASSTTCATINPILMIVVFVGIRYSEQSET